MTSVCRDLHSRTARLSHQWPVSVVTFTAQPLDCLINDQCLSWHSRSPVSVDTYWSSTQQQSCQCWHRPLTVSTQQQSCQCWHILIFNTAAVLSVLTHTDLQHSSSPVSVDTYWSSTQQQSCQCWHILIFNTAAVLSVLTHTDLQHSSSPVSVDTYWSSTQQQSCQCWHILIFNTAAVLSVLTHTDLQHSSSPVSVDTYWSSTQQQSCQCWHILIFNTAAVLSVLTHTDLQHSSSPVSVDTYWSSTQQQSCQCWHILIFNTAAVLSVLTHSDLQHSSSPVSVDTYWSSTQQQSCQCWHILIFNTAAVLSVLTHTDLQHSSSPVSVDTYWSSTQQQSCQCWHILIFNTAAVLSVLTHTDLQHSSSPVSVDTYSEDSALNKSGILLLYMRTTFDRCLLNGACDGDLQGRYTDICGAGNSRNDYLLLSCHFLLDMKDSCQTCYWSTSIWHTPTEVYVSFAHGKCRAAQENNCDITIDQCVWNEIEGFQPEWCISTIYHAWDTPFWLGTLEMYSAVFTSTIHSDEIQRRIMHAVTLIDDNVNEVLSIFNTCANDAVERIKRKYRTAKTRIARTGTMPCADWRNVMFVNF